MMNEHKLCIWCGPCKVCYLSLMSVQYNLARFKQVYMSSESDICYIDYKMVYIFSIYACVDANPVPPSPMARLLQGILTERVCQNHLPAISFRCQNSPPQKKKDLYFYHL